MSENTKGFHIDIQELSKQFGAVQVLQNVNLTVPKGQFVALVGQSGCGKSTLLRLISGLDKSNAGVIRFDGRPVAEIQPGVRFMFQEARLLPWKTVWENVALGCQTRDRDAAIEALKAVQLAEKVNDWPADLSGGQQQRVALARALVGNPQLLLLDEPLGALDALTRIQMQSLIEQLWKQQGFTIILVTHDVSEAVNLADRVVLIEAGGIALDIPITLARPRVRDSSFAYFEKLILDKVMRKPLSEATADTIYAI